MRIRVTVIHRNAERVACRASLIGPLEKFLPKRTARSMNILACDQKNMVRFSIRYGKYSNTSCDIFRVNVPRESIKRNLN